MESAPQFQREYKGLLWPVREGRKDDHKIISRGDMDAQFVKPGAWEVQTACEGVIFWVSLEGGDCIRRIK